MSNKPLVSAIIVCYNQKEYIRTAIESLLSQELNYPYEIVIGDDASTDGTRDVVESYRKKHHPRIRVVASAGNVGLLENFHRTVSACNGKYIAGCAGDDYWHDLRRLQIQADFLESHPDCGMVHSDAHHLYEETQELVKNINVVMGYTPQNSQEDCLRRILTDEYYVIAGTAMFRKELFDAHFKIDEYRANGITIEDYPLWIEMAAHARIHYMRQSFLTHREMLGTVSNPSTLHGRIAFAQSCYRCMEYFHERYRHILTRGDLEKMHLSFNRRILNMAIEADDRALAKESYRNMIGLGDRAQISVRDRMLCAMAHVPGSGAVYRCLKRLRKGLQARRQGVSRDSERSRAHATDRRSAEAAS